MIENDDAQKDYAPYPHPFPVSSGFSPLDSDDRKEWRKDKAKWEAEHGHPDENKPPTT